MTNRQLDSRTEVSMVSISRINTIHPRSLMSLSVQQRHDGESGVPTGKAAGAVNKRSAPYYRIQQTQLVD